MKETTRTSRTAGYLEKIFRALNTNFFGGELEEPIITIQSTPRAYGHVSIAKVWRQKGEERHELNLGAETLNRPIENVVATMMHEMVHLYNMAHQVQDTSRGGTYHNKRFRDAATERGLIISHNERIGWSITEPGEVLIDYIISQGWGEIYINRGPSWKPTPTGGSKDKDGTGTDAGNGKKPSSTRKLICPTCGQSVRATRAVNIICGDCMERMVTAL